MWLDMLVHYISGKPGRQVGGRRLGLGTGLHRQMGDYIARCPSFLCYSPQLIGIVSGGDVCSAAVSRNREIRKCKDGKPNFVSVILLIYKLFLICIAMNNIFYS